MWEKFFPSIFYIRKVLFLHPHLRFGTGREKLFFLLPLRPIPALFPKVSQAKRKKKVFFNFLERFFFFFLLDIKLTSDTRRGRRRKKNVRRLIKTVLLSSFFPPQDFEVKQTLNFHQSFPLKWSELCANWNEFPSRRSFCVSFLGPPKSSRDIWPHLTHWHSSMSVRAHHLFRLKWVSLMASNVRTSVLQSAFFPSYMSR